MLETRDSIKSVKGIGDVGAKHLASMGIHNVGELITHYPFKYDRFSTPVAIASVPCGSLSSVEGIITKSPTVVGRGNIKIISTVIRDDTGEMTVRWFNMPYLYNTLKLGQRYIFTGKAERDRGGLTMTQPEINTKEKYIQLLKEFRPVYRTVNGLKQAQIRKAMKSAFDVLLLADYLPKKTVKEFGLPPLREALYDIHFPEDEDTLGRSLRRIIFDEFFAFFGRMKKLKGERQALENKKKIVFGDEINALRAELGFELTDDQEKAIEDIKNDISGDFVMQRLLQGDVGSGKTVVALFALFATALSGYQGCIMAPTEALCEQHYLYFLKMLLPHGIRVVRLTGSMTAAEKRNVLAEIKDGTADIVVGTHAAIQEKVEFKNLAMAVIDEQHRFGVNQRRILEEKGESVHLLLASATPIPRTYALMLYGDMDISVIAQMPSGRKKIKNAVVTDAMRTQINNFLIKQVREGHQAYIICPMIEESESLDAAAVKTYVNTLREQLPEDITIDALDGKMKASAKQDVMDRFIDGETDILVSTTVIEVGINVPNATVMVIENAERFGLAQLHQIRGRVGRGEAQSYCVFVSSQESEASKERLGIVAGSDDGFYIAGKDMKLRGPGDFFGIKQSGEHVFELADPMRDTEVMQHAKEAVDLMSEEELNNALRAHMSVVSDDAAVVY